jgi:hypothetical protein
MCADVGADVGAGVLWVDALAHGCGCGDGYGNENERMVCRRREEV